MAAHIDRTPPTEAVKDGTNGEDPSDSGLQTTNESANQKSDTTIFKVNMGLRESNLDAYIPKLISIGPYHNKNPKLSSMKKFKQLYLQRFLNRKKRIIDSGSCIEELEKLKDKALACYDDKESLDKDIVDNFSEIMLLDGCFLVEFIRERFGSRPVEKKDYQKIIDKKWMRLQVRRDMVVLENQLPFFVLTKLYDMTKRPNEESFLYMVARTLLNVSPKTLYIPKLQIDRLNAEQFDHLLHVVHMLSCPSGMIYSRQRTDASKKEGFCNKNIFFGEILQRMKRSKEIPHNPNIWENIPSAAKLYEVGVSFMKIGSVDEDPLDITTLLDIKFENGLLEIPCFRVDDSTETVLRI